ncbi:hypothetical protein C8T65DRAFT_574198, partial [Cerioporus squamosus]
LVDHITSLRRHMGAMHEAVYCNWCNKNNFASMLPKDTKQRHEAKAAGTAQSTLDAHLREMPAPERVVKYTDALFREAAIEWLVSTDQPVQAFEHPAFKNMIDIAARATEGVKIPNCKATQREIIDMFKRNLTKLRNRLNVRNSRLYAVVCMHIWMLNPAIE